MPINDMQMYRMRASLFTHAIERICVTNQAASENVQLLLSTAGPEEAALLLLHTSTYCKACNVLRKRHHL